METIILNVNGEDFSVKIEKKTPLLDVLRDQLNLTGAKAGCRTGDCGACKVIIDGEAVNSCLYLAINAVGKKIETIEGLSKGTDLHPVQKAFVHTGAIQCGYCTPGMVMSSKALLDKNPSPDKEEIKEALSGNLCRCTGYAKIVEAVSLASKLISGEVTETDLDGQGNDISAGIINEAERNQITSRDERIDEPGNGVVGSRYPIRDAKLKVTGQLRYAADLKLPHMIHGKILTSPVAHARIKSINLEKARALPGVRAAVCYQDAPRVYFNSCGETIEVYKNERLFDDTVRYVGDFVAAVAADDEKTAEMALRLIEVEYEELPANFDPEKGMEEDAYVIHQSGSLEKGNLIVSVVQEAGDVDKGFAEADQIFENRYTLPAIHHGPIETHACIASYDPMGKLTIYSSSQDSFAMRYNLARIFDMPMSKIRVVVPSVGGGFGGKVDMTFEHIAALLAMKAGRPVKMQLSRKDDIVSTRTRHQMVIYLKTGVKIDGTITAEEMKMVCNAGAYASGSSSVVWAQCGKFFKLHRTKNLRYTGYPVITNSPSGGAMRGYGSPQLFFAQQRQMNRIAKALGMDMVDLQRINLTLPDGVDERSGKMHGNPRPLDCLEEGYKLFNYPTAVQEQENASGRYRIGIGLATGAHGNGMFPFLKDIHGTILKMNEDGTVVIYTGSHEMGNFSITTQGQIVAEELGISFDRIEFVQADTDAVLYQLGCWSSRGAFVSGYAALDAARALKKKILPLAAELLESEESELQFHDNAVHSPKGSVSFGKIAMHSRNKHSDELCVSITHESFTLATSYGAHFVKVQVDTETGAVKILDYAAVHDVGRAINPLGVEGQIEGAIMMGLGYATSEEMALDSKGRVRNSNLRTYKLTRANQMPEQHKIKLVEELEYGGPYGAKSIGECSLVPVTPAIVNAISNAIGVEFDDLPVTPEKILSKLKGLLA
ncbi:MAG TPA: molybdopterin-dependent oxidoreductase [Anaerolineaceae bacterium]|nr:molybdopterin-dependent oxidoreductase [Anaerolineaceae bacterium]